MLAPRGPSGFGYGSTAEEVTQGLSLAGKTMLVTGCNSGIGFETLRVLALRGARVLGSARTLEKAQKACAGVQGEALPFACELAEPASVRACVEAIKRTALRLDAVICNAGIMALPRLELAHGYELQFFTNHIGHFALVNGCLESLGPQARVVVLSSSAHRRAPPVGIDFDNLAGERGYQAWQAYGRSKLANLLFAKHLARRFAGSGRTANAVHPGVISTQLQRHMPGLLSATLRLARPLALKSVEQGAATQVYVATHPSLSGVSGQYFANCNLAQPRADADDPQLAQKLWELSERIVSSTAPPSA
jgi:WW domain-containing oxidoreductase